jgi:hypothetical protein
MTYFWADLIPLPSRLETMDDDALGLCNFCHNCDHLGQDHRDAVQSIFRDFLDSGHPLALDGQRYATAASACLKLIFKHYQVPLSCFQRFSRHSLTPRLTVDMEYLFHRRHVNPPGWMDFLETYFSCFSWDVYPGISGIYDALDVLQRARSSQLQFLLEKSAYSNTLVNFARRRVFRFGYLQRNHPKYMKKAICALAKYIHRVTGGPAEIRACELIWGRDKWFTAQ